MLAALRTTRASSHKTPRQLLCAFYATQPASTTNTDLLEDLSSNAFDDEYAKPPVPPPGSYPSPVNPFLHQSTKRNAGKLLSIVPRSSYKLHCHSTRNNTITTLCRPDGGVMAWFSGGSCGFKKVNRASYEAGYQCAVRMFQTIEDTKKTLGPFDVELFFKGFGQGRDALQKALLTSEGEAIRSMVTRVTDRTPIKIGGTRAKKTRRL